MIVANNILGINIERWQQTLYWFGVLWIVGGCVSAPTPPQAEIPPAENGTQTWIESNSTQLANVSFDAKKWWQQFEDPILESLINTALQENLSIAQAQSRLREALAVQRQISSLRWPTIVANHHYTWAEQSISSPGGPSSLISAGFIDRDLEFWGASIAMNWDVDLFGAHRYKTRAAIARSFAMDASVKASKNALLSAVATAYVDYVSARHQHDVLNRSLQRQTDSLSLLEKRQAIGLESKLNVERAAAQLAANRARLPGFRIQQRAAFHRLNVLTGYSAQELDDKLSRTRFDLQWENFETPIGIKSDLLQRRPDIAIAQNMMQAMAQEVGAARADRFPRLTLSASTGYESGSLDQLFDANSRTQAVAPSVSHTIFGQGRLRAQAQAALARYEESAQRFKEVVLSAFAETETRLATVNGQQQIVTQLAQASSLSQAAAERAQKLYDRGLIAYLDVLDAERAAFDTQVEWVASQRALVLAHINLFVSAGGDWPDSPIK